VRRADIISGSLILLSGLVMIFVIVPQQIKSSSDYGLDPAFFPLALVWLIVLMGGLLVVTRIPQPADPPEAEPVLDRWNWGFVLVTGVFLVLGFTAIKALGFVIAGSIMVAVLMLALEWRNLRWIEVIGISALVPFIIYWLLFNIFNVQLPSGPLLP
jgi:hypothetical protein